MGGAAVAPLRGASHAEAFLADLHFPHLPSVDEIRRYAEQHLASTVSLDEIARRARQILLESIAVRLLAKAAAGAAGLKGPSRPLDWPHRYRQNGPSEGPIASHILNL